MITNIGPLQECSMRPFDVSVAESFLQGQVATLSPNLAAVGDRVAKQSTNPLRYSGIKMILKTS
jgi:hypothetical protein